MEPNRQATYSNLPLRAVSKETAESEGAKAHLSLLRDAIRQRLILRITNMDLSDNESERTIRPLGLTLFDSAWLLTGWCETRDDFRNFRADRIAIISTTGITFRHEKGRRFEDYLKTLWRPEPVRIRFSFGNDHRDGRSVGQHVAVMTDRLSRNLFLNGFPRNCPLDMEKRDAPQTSVCVTERLSNAIHIKRCHLTRHAIYAP